MLCGVRRRKGKAPVAAPPLYKCAIIEPNRKGEGNDYGTSLDTARVTAESRQAVQELLAAAGLRAGDIFVIGCSSSEIVGGHIGKDSSMEAAAAVLAGVAPVLAEKGISLAAQCCEHLNRAIVLERAVAERCGYEPVNAVPQPHAGGSWATSCWRAFRDPVLVEEVRARPRASTSAARSSACTCAAWPCRCG